MSRRLAMTWFSTTPTAARFHPFRLLTAVLVMLVLISLLSRWYATAVSLPRYCAQPEETLLRLADPEASDAESMSLWTARFGLVLVFAGLAFKIAAAPFHFYAPDVYEGATNPNAGLLAIAPKIAGMVALIRLGVAALPGVAEFGWQLAMVMALLTMTIGNVCALWQKNLRRLMAYSSIAHAGYMLIGLSVGIAATPDQTPYGGVAAVTFYLITYVMATLAFFSISS